VITGLICFPALATAQNDEQKTESRGEIKVTIERNDDGNTSRKRDVKMIVIKDSAITVNGKTTGGVESFTIGMDENEGTMDILVHDKNGEKKLRIDLENMAKELEELSRRIPGEINEEEIDRIVEKYLPKLDELEDMGVHIEKEMERLDIDMSRLEKELEQLEGLHIDIDALSDTVINETTILNDGKLIKKVVIVRSHVNVSDLTDDEWKSIRKRDGETQNTMSVDKLEFYPNPSDGKFTVNFASPERGDLKISVTDMNGKTVYQETVQGFQGTYSKAYDLSGAGKGMYILRMSIGKNAFYKKMIIE